MPLEPIEENDLGLEAKFAVSRASGAEMGPAAPERLETKEVVSEKNKAEVVAQIEKLKPQADRTTGDGPSVDSAAKIGVESQVKRLVDLAMEKGPEEAIKAADQTPIDDYPPVIDAVHDKLASEEVRADLVKGGKIQEEL